MPPRKRRDTGPAWTAPGEKDTLVGFLDYLRNAIVDKVADVPEPEVRTAGVPSGTNLLGLIKHVTAVERFYFLEEPITDMRRTFQPTRDDTWTDLTRPAPRPPGRALPPSQRWVLVHMIEEIGRHAGHADIIRERIDGATGR
ncbi:DinB family protein [Streptomyces sp. NPDC052644]